eukprot:6176040-Pleurochrysis_carterae.AAC.2
MVQVSKFLQKNTKGWRDFNDPGGTNSRRLMLQAAESIRSDSMDWNKAARPFFNANPLCTGYATGAPPCSSSRVCFKLKLSESAHAAFAVASPPTLIQPQLRHLTFLATLRVASAKRNNGAADTLRRERFDTLAQTLRPSRCARVMDKQR